ncbi:MAG: hypothetical protein K2X87_30040 [Gemmataceae bacterium]|nr:hypothetical protein [Gemmataceae bacterium]
MPPKSARPGGRKIRSAGHVAPPTPAPDGPLAELLDGIASDPDAGAWGDWAARLLASGEADATPARPADGPEAGSWRPRKPR